VATGGKYELNSGKLRIEQMERGIACFQTGRIDAVLNKKYRTADKGRSSSWRFCECQQLFAVKTRMLRNVTSYYHDDQLKGDEIGCACRMQEMRNAYKI
jgi:hypothetical protein